jgi:hypothetical protein
MPTLREFEEALREHGMHMALAILQRLRERDRAKRTVAPARRVTGQKMTPELARRILALHASTGMTQQEIAFELGVNQGRVNEVIKRGKWLSGDPAAPEAVARDKALARMRKASGKGGAAKVLGPPKAVGAVKAKARSKRSEERQLTFADL